MSIRQQHVERLLQRGLEAQREGQVQTAAAPVACRGDDFCAEPAGQRLSQANPAVVY